MTDEIERGALELIERIQGAGGTLAAIEAGIIQREIQDAAYAVQQAIDAGTTVVVGVNRFTADPDPGVDTLQLDPEIERRQIDRVREVRASRGVDAWHAALQRLAVAARDGINLVPPVIAAVEAHGTLGEIADTLRGVFGEYREGYQE